MNLDLGIDLPRIRLSGFDVEWHIRKQIDLGQDQQRGLVEDGWIFQRLVLAFGHAEQDDLRLFAEVVAGRANQIADVFDEQDVDVFQRPGCERALDHLAVEVADATGDDLLHRKAVACQPPRVVLGLQIAGQNRDLLAGSETPPACFRAAWSCPSRAS